MKKTLIIGIFTATLLISALYSCEENGPETPPEPEEPVITDTLRPSVALEDVFSDEESVSFTIIPTDATACAWTVIKKADMASAPTAEEIISEGTSAPADGSSDQTATGLEHYSDYVVLAAVMSRDSAFAMTSAEIATKERIDRLTEGSLELVSASGDTRITLSGEDYSLTISLTGAMAGSFGLPEGEYELNAENTELTAGGSNVEVESGTAEVSLFEGQTTILSRLTATDGTYLALEYSGTLPLPIDGEVTESSMSIIDNGFNVSLSTDRYSLSMDLCILSETLETGSYTVLDMPVSFSIGTQSSITTNENTAHFRRGALDVVNNEGIFSFTGDITLDTENSDIIRIDLSGIEMETPVAEDPDGDTVRFDSATADAVLLGTNPGSATEYTVSLVGEHYDMEFVFQEMGPTDKLPNVTASYDPSSEGPGVFHEYTITSKADGSQVELSSTAYSYITIEEDGNRILLHLIKADGTPFEGIFEGTLLMEE